MSLLLDALKKAAEKNANKDASSKSDEGATKVDLTVAIDRTVLADKTEVAEQVTLEPEPKVTENITEFELAQIISEQKNKEISQTVDDNNSEPLGEADKSKSVQYSAEDETDINVKKPTIDDVVDNDPSLALYDEDEDPSLKLALSDEEILLTDDDVTEFLGGDELHSHLDSSVFSLVDDETNFSIKDRTSTQSLNLVDPPSEYTLSRDDTTTGLRDDLTSTTRNAGQTTNLNSLTNDATMTRQDLTSTHTFASDNYDRTLVKLEDDVSKVFTGMKSNKAGAAMTPDFAKKVFVRKSTSLRRQNYKIYGVISIVVLIAISVLAMFEMQSQIEEIDTSLVRLKQNPVPSALRFQRKEKSVENNAALEGRIDTEALNLLRSLTGSKENSALKETNELSKNQTVETVVKQTSVENNNGEVTQDSNLAIKEDTDNKIAESTMSMTKPIEPERVIAKVKKQNTSLIKKEAKPSIKIETKLAVSKESLWLKQAYTAFENGDMQLAAMNYERVLAKNSTNRDALLGQAAVYATQNKSTQAINNYQAILLENPKDPVAMTSLIAASTMSPIESESRLKLLQRESPKATYLQFALGNVISAQNRWQEAQQYYFKAYQAEPNNPDYAYNLAVSLEQINKPDIAINYYTQALKNAKTSHAMFNTTLIEQRIEVLKQ